MSTAPRVFAVSAASSFFVLAAPATTAASGQDLGTKRTSVFGPAVEYTLRNPSWEGNPFDLEATATFTHPQSGQTFQHPWYYAGESDLWKLRFTGIQPGRWTFTTSSRDRDLDGRTGTIEVAADPDARGFTVAAGYQWAQQRGDGTLNAIAPQLVMYDRYVESFDTPKIERDIDTFLVQHGFTGFHVPSIAGQWFDHTKKGRVQVDPSMQDPDPRTFEALERLIRKTHAAGGHVHIWIWGDAARSQTPDRLTGGKNGEIDQRLQRYIAARLGPLPGWSMGYGFDLDEWAGANKNPSIVKRWEDYLLNHSGYPHLFGGRSLGPNEGKLAEDIAWNAHFGYAGYEHHRPSYDDYRAVMTAAVDGRPLSTPVLSEDRFRIRDGKYRSKDYNEQQTRRGMWASMMAGGVANIWGHLIPHGNVDDYVSAPYSDETRASLKTWNCFWFEGNRFQLGMQPANELTPDPMFTGDDGRRLKIIGTVVLADGHDLIVAYGEDTNRITLDLSSLGRHYRAIAVDTLRPYEEIELGEVSGTAELSLPAHSDWALALTPVSDHDPSDP
jgi:hypothetical protein